MANPAKQQPAPPGTQGDGIQGDAGGPIFSPLSRRGFLRRAALAGLEAGAGAPAEAKAPRPFSPKIGLQKAGWGDTPLAEFLTAARDLGYDGVELAPPWLEKEGISLADIDRALTKAKMETAPAVFVGGRELRDPGARKSCLARARKHARWIASHGGKNVIFSTVGRSGAQQRRRVFEGFDAVADAVLAEGCAPLYHNHFVESHEASKRYLEEDLESLDWSRWKLCVDTGHLVLALTDAVKFLQNWAGRARWMHCKDVKSRDLKTLSQARWSENFTVLGTGVVDFPGILRQLAAADYKGWLVVEQDNTPDPVATSRRAIQYLRKLPGQAG